MIYIQFPENYTFNAKYSTTDKPEEVYDALLKDNSEEPINLQALIKDALQNHKKGRSSTKHEEITLYYRKPPVDHHFYLQYEPKNNGKYPAENWKMVKGTDVAAYNPAKHTQYGGSWFQQTPLSRQQLDKTEEKRTEQRKNRQKTGDSPSAN